MAFLSVFAGKRLGYEVTPKGNAQVQKVDLTLFFPHVLFGTATALCIMVGVLTDNTPSNLITVALLNTLAMYGFFSIALLDRCKLWFLEKSSQRTLKVARTTV